MREINVQFRVDDSNPVALCKKRGGLSRMFVTVQCAAHRRVKDPLM